MNEISTYPDNKIKILRWSLIVFSILAALSSVDFALQIMDRANVTIGSGRRARTVWLAVLLFYLVPFLVKPVLGLFAAHVLSPLRIIKPRTLIRALVGVAFFVAAYSVWDFYRMYHGLFFSEGSKGIAIWVDRMILGAPYLIAQVSLCLVAAHSLKHKWCGLNEKNARTPNVIVRNKAEGLYVKILRWALILSAFFILIVLIIDDLKGGKAHIDNQTPWLKILDQALYAMPSYAIPLFALFAAEMTAPLKAINRAALFWAFIFIAILSPLTEFWGTSKAIISHPSIELKYWMHRLHSISDPALLSTLCLFAAYYLKKHRGQRND